MVREKQQDDLARSIAERSCRSPEFAAKMAEARQRAQEQYAAQCLLERRQAVDPSFASLRADARAQHQGADVARRRELRWREDVKHLRLDLN